MMIRKLVATSALILICGHNASARVAPTNLKSLVARSDIIAVVNVVKIHSKNGAKIAECSVSRIMKGPKDLKPLYFAALPTWACDISTAEEGENALIFLQKIKDRSLEGRNKDPYYDWKLPAKGYEPLYKITSYGRRRMHSALAREKKDS